MAIRDLQREIDTLRDARKLKRKQCRYVNPVPYKRATAFRRWLTEPDIDVMLANCPARVRDKLLYEFDKIALRITALKKKHS